MNAIPSWLLVALQFALIAALLLTTEAAGTPVANALAFACVIAGTFVGVAALAANRPGNFNVRPELKNHARLVTDGIYAHLRHPMYTAVLLVMLRRSPPIPIWHRFVNGSGCAGSCGRPICTTPCWWP